MGIIKDKDPRNAELDKFAGTWNVPNSPMHFKMEKILEIRDEMMTLQGREGKTNNIRIIKVPEVIFNRILDQYPEQTAFLMRDYYREHILEKMEEDD